MASALCRAATVPLRWVARWVRTSRDFPGFPNPHLRFNAILIRAELLRRFAAEHRPPTTKRQSHVLESGRQGLTRFAEAAGQTVLVCGADGRGYRQQDWLDANTLYTPGQPNLLIADNHTRRYSDASVRGRRHLETLNWARTLTPPGSAA